MSAEIKSLGQEITELWQPVNRCIDWVFGKFNTPMRIVIAVTVAKCAMIAVFLVLLAQ